MNNKERQQKNCPYLLNLRSHEANIFLKEREIEKILTSFKKDGFLPKALDETSYARILCFNIYALHCTHRWCFTCKYTRWLKASGWRRRRREKEERKRGGEVSLRQRKNSSGPCVIYIVSGIKPGNEWRSVCVRTHNKRENSRNRYGL